MFDGLGSTRTTCNSSQTVTATATYEGFGSTIATTGSTGSKYGFAATSGYRTDGDAGLMHVGARYYDAQVGRFVTRDTDLEEHAYLYCEHDPVNCVDPSGHSMVGDWLTGIKDWWREIHLPPYEGPDPLPGGRSQLLKGGRINLLNPGEEPQPFNPPAENPGLFGRIINGVGSVIKGIRNFFGSPPVLPIIVVPPGSIDQLDRNAIKA